MQVLIIGASGFVGNALLASFGHDAAGTYFSHPEDGLRQLDIRDARAVERLIAELHPDIIIHPAAQPNVDWCEEHVQESHAINVTGTQNVAAAAASARIRYVFFSTDYVFDGTSGPYREDAPTAPPNVYGRHKLQSERLIQDMLDDYVIVRVCNVFGFEPRGKNFVMGLLARSQRGETMNVPSDQWGNPTYAPNLAAAVEELAGSRLRGIYHVVGPDNCDRISFARLACNVFGLDPSFLRPRTTAELGQRAARPLRGGLNNAKAATALTTPLIDPRRGLELMRDRLRQEGMLA